MKTVYAFTEENQLYPRYVNISKVGEEYVLVIRGGGTYDKTGPTVSIGLSKNELIKLNIAINNELS